PTGSRGGVARGHRPRAGAVVGAPVARALLGGRRGPLRARRDERGAVEAGGRERARRVGGRVRGNGDPPREIAWDGRGTDGTPVLPGTSYSYLFEARDKAGNKRNFVGEGFRVNAFRFATAHGPMLVFSSQELERPGGAPWGPDEAPPIVIELATAMNQEPADRAVRIAVTAGSADEANALGRRLVRWLTPYVIGDPSRLQSAVVVASDAPAGGAVTVTTE